MKYEDHCESVFTILKYHIFVGDFETKLLWLGTILLNITPWGVDVI